LNVSKETIKLSKTKQILILTLLTLMIIAALQPIVGAQQSDWQAYPMYKVKAQNVDPYSLGANNPYYAPLDIREAYHIPATGDSGTIAIIEAYDNPKVATDLAYFCSVFSWPSANLEVHKMSSFILPNAGWALESDLDVQWAHAVAPHAKLLLVEAKSASITDLIAAVDYANSRTDVVAISMSWGSNENTGQIAYDSHFTTNGKIYFASSGDVGGVVSWPSSSPNVVSVGGTKLTMTTTGYTETAWTDGGGGVSTIETIPTYQIGVTNSYSQSKRATPDVAYNADPSTGFLVYDSYGYNGGRGWFIVGGTSAGAPQWAAIATFDKSATNTNFYTNYHYGTTFSDITTGSNGYPTATGYDLATGIGSPIGVNFGAPPAPDFSITTSSTITISTATPSGTTAVNVNYIGGFTTDIALTATDDNSAGLGISFNPTTVTSGSGSSTMTITLPANIAAGAYPITIQGTGGTITRTATINVQVVKPDFTLTANPTTLNIRRGNSASSTITVNPTGGFSGDTALGVTGNPTGMTITFSPTPTTGSSTMTVQVERTTKTGTYTLTITGTAGSISHFLQVKVTVK
jgi:subtilase family serine protease